MAMKPVLAIFVLCLCAISVAAFNFDAVVAPESGAVIKGEIAKFNVTISQDSPSTQRFSIYSPDVTWDVPSQSVDVPPGESTTIELEVRQYVENINPGYYLVNINIRPLSQDSVIKRSVLISLRSDRETKYMPSLRVTPVVPSAVDPVAGATFKVEIANLNRLQLDQVIIKARSDLINADVNTSIGPLETKKIDIPVTLGANALHQEDSVLISAFVAADGQTYRFDSVPSSYEVLEYGEIAAQTVLSGGFPSYVKTITFTNTGNDQKSQTYRLAKPFFTSWFMSTDPEARVLRDNEGKWFAWDITLPVGGSYSVSITTNWTPLLVVVILIILCYIGYYVFRSPVVVRKNAVVVGTKEGLTDIKILVEIRNRSGNVLKNVRLIDKIPHIVQLVEEHGMGTLRPAKVIRSDKTGTLLSWNIHELDKFEERVVSYRIRSKLSIVGRLHLPVSVVKFERNPGHVRSTASNISQIGFGQ